MFYVYTHARPDGSIFYVGKGKGDRAYRTSSRTLHWRNVVAKHGVFVVSLDSRHELEADAFAREVALIAELRANGAALCNLTSGGEGCSGRDTGKKLSAEHRQKLAAAKRGTKQSPETVAKRVAKTTGQKRTPETRERMSLWARQMTPEHKARISASKQGKTYESHVVAMRAARGRAVVCLTTGQSFPTIGEAAQHFGVQRASISACCRGRAKTVGGMRWAYQPTAPARTGEGI